MVRRDRAKFGLGQVLQNGNWDPGAILKFRLALAGFSLHVVDITGVIIGLGGY
jgi:hypothetical protein